MHPPTLMTAALHGWMLYTSPAGRQGIAVAADALYGDMTADYRGGYGPAVIRLSAELHQPHIVEQHRPEQALWEVLKRWPDPRAGRRWPVELEAMLQLADRHREEYEDIREKEAVLRALGG